MEESKVGMRHKIPRGRKLMVEAAASSSVTLSVEEED